MPPEESSPRPHCEDPVQEECCAEVADRRAVAAASFAVLSWRISSSRSIERARTNDGKGVVMAMMVAALEYFGLKLRSVLRTRVLSGTGWSTSRSVAASALSFWQ